mgnify:CR=1 FL=1
MCIRDRVWSVGFFILCSTLSLTLSTYDIILSYILLKPRGDEIMPIYALRTAIGQEQSVSEYLARRADKRPELDIKAILVTGSLKGYIFIESSSIDHIELLVEGVRHVRKRPRSSRAEEIPINELEHFLMPRPVIEGVNPGDIVEIVSGPFKGSRARVTDIHSAKEEVTLELLSVDLQIPVTISGESIRVIEKAATEKEEEEGEYLL